ncbi:MAG: thioredoxin family protein [Planctomycetes bacterium]|nr:thioredoxin family protein [Planctomycetota bacterium]
MRLLFLPLAALLLAGGMLYAQEGLTAEVQPLVEGSVEPGKQWTFKLQFALPDGYHAYHKDNPGIGMAPKVKFTQTSGLKLASEVWPEPTKHKDDSGEEWEYSGTFTIGYIFDVPAGASGRLRIAGSHQTQFCDENGCFMSEAEFSADIEVISAEPVLALTVAPIAEGKAQAGKEYTLKLRFTVPAGYHAYHRDNKGYGVAPIVKWTELAGFELAREDWPKAKDRYYEELEATESEYSGTFDIAYVFKVPAGASGTIKLAGTHQTQFCNDDGCLITEGGFSAEIAVQAGAEGSKPKIPTATVSAAFHGTAKAGGEATLELTIELPEHFHTYHKDNATVKGYGEAPKVQFTQTSGMTLKSESWPDAKKVKYDEDWYELEYEGKLTLKYTFEVPSAANAKLPLTGSYRIQVCDDGGCYLNDGTFSATLEIAATDAPQPTQDRARKDSHGFYLDFDYALEQARKEGKPLLVDFNGENCAPCRKMEKTVFSLVEVKELFTGFVIASVQNDVNDVRYNELWAKYQPTPGAPVPYYAIMDHDAKVVRGIGSTLPADKRAHEFVAFLKGEAPMEPAPVADPPSKLTPAAIGPAAADAPGWPKGLFGPPTEGQAQGMEFSAAFASGKVKPGSKNSVVLKFTMKDNGAGEIYHAYHPGTKATEVNIPLTVTLKDNGGLKPTGEWKYPAPAEKVDDGFGEEWRLPHEFTLVLDFEVPSDLKPGKYTVTGHVNGQYCDSNGCIFFNAKTADSPNREFGWVAMVEVSLDGAEGGVTEATGTGGGSGIEGEVEKAGGIWLFLFFALLGGMITLLTPCVLPVLPLTVGFFVSQSEKGRSPLVTAFIYCTCIVASFTLFGLITSALVGATGAQQISTNGWVNGFLAILFLTFALSFLGLFELRVPAFMTAWFTKKQLTAQKEGKGYAKAFFSGSAFALISFSCTGPIAGAFLAGAAGGDFWLPTLAMLAFSTGMALPIFVMGQFPSLMKKLPKSGGWMNALKVVFGFVEIGLAIMYFSAAEQAFASMPAAEWVNRYVVLAVWITVSLASGLYLFGFFRMPHDHEETKQIGVIRSLFAVAFIAFALYLVPGMFGAKFGPTLEGILPLPPENGGIQLSLGGGAPRNDPKSLPWEHNLAKGLEIAAKVNKPVFVDFTGYN